MMVNVLDMDMTRQAPTRTWCQRVSRDRQVKGPPGFTLIEVVIALLLVALLLIPAMSSVAGMLANKTKRDEKTQALELARSSIEAAKALYADGFQEGTTITTVSIGANSFDVRRVMIDRSNADEGVANLGNTLWEVTVSVYKHPFTDNAEPLCSLTTLIYPQ